MFVEFHAYFLNVIGKPEQNSVSKPALKVRGNQARWAWQPHLNMKRVLIGHEGKGRSLGTPIGNILIGTPSTLATMLPVSFIVPKR